MTLFCLWQNNSRTPVVSMSKFFDLWSKVDVVLSSFDEFYYSYLKMIKSIENECGRKISEIKLEDYKQNETFIAEKTSEFDATYCNNDYYSTLLKDTFNEYFTKKNKSKAQACLKENLVYGVLAAYRLFYVGCSRARKNLAILIENSDVDGFKEHLKNKFEDIGFEIDEI